MWTTVRVFVQTWHTIITQFSHLLFCRKFHLSSETLEELGIFKSDSIEITGFRLPILRKLRIHENTVELFRKILADRQTSGSHAHRNLLSLSYDGCPNLQVGVRLG